jgi:hypothetical protein
MPEHLEEVGLSTPIKPTDPSSRLGRGVDIADVGFQDADHPVGILAFADEVFQLVAECLQFLCREGLTDRCDAIIEEPCDRGVALEDFTVLHLLTIPLCSVIGTAR